MNDVIVVEARKWRTNGLVLLAFGLSCVISGYTLAVLYSGSPKSTELEMTERLQQAKAGDFAILKDGEVFRIGGSVEKAVIEAGHIYYNTRSTDAANHLYRPHWQMAALVVEVISPTSKNYAVIDKCFNKGMFVTTVGPAKWTCT